MTEAKERLRKSLERLKPWQLRTVMHNSREIEVRQLAYSVWLERKYARKRNS